MTIGELVYKIKGDTGNFDKSMKGVDAQATKSTKGLKNLSLGAVALGVAIVAAGKKLFDMAVKAGQYADKMLDLEQVTGLSTDSLQQLEFVAAEAGVSFDGLVGSVTKFTTKIPQIEIGTGPIAENFAKLNVELYDTEGQLRNTGDVFLESVQVLASMDNQTERNVIATQLFGRSLNDLAPVLGLTAEELQAAIDRGEDFGAIIDREALVAANRFRASLDTLNLALDKTGTQMGADIAPAFELFTVGLSGGLAVFKDFSNELKDSFGRIGENTENLNKSTDSLITSMAFGGNVFTIVAASAKVLGITMELFFGLLSANKQIVMTFFDTMLVGAQTAAESIGALYDVFTGEKSLEEAFAVIKEGGQETWNALKEGAGGVVDTVQTTFSDAGDSIGNFQEDVDALSAQMENSYKRGSDGAAAAIEYNANRIEESLEETAAAGEEAGKSIGKAFENTKDPILGAVHAIETFMDRMEHVVETAQPYADSILGSWSMLANAQSMLSQARVDELDYQMQEELDNAALTSEEREQIEAEFAKKKAKIEYKGKLASWRFSLAEAVAAAPVAIINAMNTGFGAGFPLGLVLGPALAALAATATAVQIAAIVKSKPKAPKFQTGGLVPGRSFIGDNINIKANTDEEVLTTTDPRHAFNQGRAGNSQSGGGDVYLDGTKVGRFITGFLNDGRGHLKQDVILT